MVSAKAASADAPSIACPAREQSHAVQAHTSWPGSRQAPRGTAPLIQSETGPAPRAARRRSPALRCSFRTIFHQAGSGLARARKRTGAAGNSAAQTSRNGPGTAGGASAIASSADCQPPPGSARCSRCSSTNAFSRSSLKWYRLVTSHLHHSSRKVGVKSTCMFSYHRVATGGALCTSAATDHARWKMDCLTGV